jgi:hypothetical protein
LKRKKRLRFNRESKQLIIAAAAVVIPALIEIVRLFFGR